MRYLSFLVMMAAMLAMSATERRYVGGDISLLPEYVKAGAQYYDHDGEPVEALLPWCREQGMNAMRVRLFVNPDRYKQEHADDKDGDTRYDPNACQDLKYITPLCQDIVNSGMDVMLDFHYSDTWADPAKQWTPADWVGLDDDQLCDKIYDYTLSTLLALKEAGVTPAFIQPGNEISYGMLWGPVGTKDPLKTYTNSDANWERLGRLLGRAIQACREVCPDAKIVIHTERVAQTQVLTAFYDRMARLGVDYDIIGLSYYPFWHGDMAQLDASLTALERDFPGKNIMIVETGYGLRWQVPYHDIADHTSTWPISDEGQAKFVQDLVDTLERHPAADGLFWWWMEYNPYNTDLTGWYNAPLFDPLTGRASSALKVMCSYATGSDGITDATVDNKESVCYDLQGRPVDPDTYRGIIVANGRKSTNR